MMRGMAILILAQEELFAQQVASSSPHLVAKHHWALIVVSGISASNCDK